MTTVWRYFRSFSEGENITVAGNSVGSFDWKAAGYPPIVVRDPIYPNQKVHLYRMSCVAKNKKVDIAIGPVCSSISLVYVLTDIKARTVVILRVTAMLLMLLGLFASIAYILFELNPWLAFSGAISTFIGLFAWNYGRRLYLVHGD